MVHATRLTLDVVMEDFCTRRTGVYGKPVWLRPGVLQYRSPLSPILSHPSHTTCL